MARQNSAYWQKRMEALEDKQYQNGAEYYKDVQKQFREASNNVQVDIERWYQRLADNNNLSYAGAKKLLKKDELDEFHWSVEQYIKAGEENAVDQRWLKELENASARHHISYLEAMKLQTQQHAELLSTEFEGGMTEFLHKSYGDQYYHTVFEIAKGTGVGSNMAQIDSRTIDTLIRKPWAQDGKNFSDRIWTNKDKLVNNLHTELTQSIIRGADPKQAIDNLAKTMEVSRAQAGRLIMTESAAVSAAAQKECFKDLDVERYEILATLDSHTSDICQEMDGKVFEMKDYEVGTTAPPFHPNCRSTTIPYFDDEFTEGEERAARDEVTGKTYYVPADMKYWEWEKQFVDQRLVSDKMASASSLNWNNTKPRTLSEEEKKQLTDYASEHNMTIFNLNKFDGEPEILKEQMDSLIKMKVDFPEYMPKKLTLSFSDKMADDEFADTRGKTITFNTKVLRDRMVTEKNMENSGIFAAKRSKDIAIHESGHLIASVKGERGLELARKAYYNVYKEEATIDETLTYLSENVSQYSISYHGSPEDQEYRFNAKRFREIIPEVLSKNSSAGNEFTREFLRLLKEGM